MLFKLNVEQAHNLVVLALRTVGSIPGGRSLLKMNYSEDRELLNREVFGLRFKNPIGLAAGFDVNGDIISEVESLGFGFVEIGAVTAEPQVGNPKPRLFRLPDDMALINRMGQPNKGLKYVVDNLRNRKGDIVVGCNIARNSFTSTADAPREYLRMFRNLYQYVDYFTVSVASTISLSDGVVFDEDVLRSIITPLFEFRRGQSDYRPILIKLSPDLSDEQIDRVVDLMIDTSLDGVVAVSGTFKREGLKSNDLAIARIGNGRMCGEPLRERALEVIRRVSERSGGAYPIIGVGGVMSAEDAQNMLDAGASLVQAYSGFIYEGPSFASKICRGLK